MFSALDSAAAAGGPQAVLGEQRVAQRARAEAHQAPGAEVLHHEHAELIHRLSHRLRRHLRLVPRILW